MKLLFDNNLSVRLVRLLHDQHPEASHVALVGLERGTDSEIWEFARAHNFVITTKDADFHDLSMQLGAPPKILWLRIGNCTTAHIADIIRRTVTEIASFAANPDAAILILTDERI